MNWRIVPTVFLIGAFAFLSFKTLSDYGVNWDTYQHMVRGHIYLRYLTTGKTDPVDVTTTIRPSYYQKSPLDWSWTNQMTIGHPPVSDILMAATNRFLWGRFGIFGDIESHFAFVIAMTVLAAVVIGIWSYLTFGPISSFFSVLAFITLPQLFAEQHFNNKDPLVTAYYTGSLFFLWCAVRYKKIWPILISAVFFGLSLGTKFNIIFSILILLPWALSIDVWKTSKLRTVGIAAFFLIPIIAYAIFFLSYPALWSAPVQKTIEVIQYYRGVSHNSQTCPYYPGTMFWLLKCSDWKTPLLFIVTTPLPTIILFLIGLVILWKNAFKNNSAVFLWILWIFLTIGRATVPLMSLYGTSLRQITEYIVPLSLIAGAAAVSLIQSFRSRSIKIAVLCVLAAMYIPIVTWMMRTHPNENVYFNSFIGGLSGAMKFNLEGANNTYGNAYKQGTQWLNTHAEKGATVALGTGIFSAIPTLYYRSDLNLIAANSKLYDLGGEYIIELAYPGMNVDGFFRMRYVRQFLNPVYTVSMDGVPLLFIWKNDTQHLLDITKMDVEVAVQNKRLDPNGDVIQLSFDKNRSLKRLEFYYDNPVCRLATQNMSVVISEDSGNHWFRMRETPGEFINELPKGVQDVYFFSGEHASDIRLYSHPPSACLLKDVTAKVIGFP